MPCFHPLDAWKTSDGQILFYESRHHDIVSPLKLPCGQCVGCRLERSRQWAVRCVHESKLHSESSFITLTYDDDHLPRNGSLNYADFQKFIKRLRKRLGRFRFYMCGEYGEDFDRAHFHACIFGTSFPDRTLWKKTPSGSILYRSRLLESCWPFGFSSVGEFSFESAAYVARYCMKKVTGVASQSHYEIVDDCTGEIISRTPEFTRMSLKPGIGGGWIDKYHSDVFPVDFVVMNGVEASVPKYYSRRFEKSNPMEFLPVRIAREFEAFSNAYDSTPARLAVREQVTQARLSSFHRSLK